MLTLSREVRSILYSLKPSFVCLTCIYVSIRPKGQVFDTNSAVVPNDGSDDYFSAQCFVYNIKNIFTPIRYVFIHKVF